MSQGHLFGGNWTEEKLSRVKKYLKAYTTIMRCHFQKFSYIDAFAGTGYRTAPAEVLDLLKAFDDEETQEFLDGSARIALDVQPEFSSYVFVEKSKKHFRELEKLRSEFPDKSDRIEIVNREANEYLEDICKRDWLHQRAVLFLDPYGMQVRWTTIQAIAETRAIDLWYLFPLGVAVNRLLPRDGQISPSWKTALDTIFGTQEWYEAFYRREKYRDMFGNPLEKTTKTADTKAIKRFLVERLKTVFATGGVAENPLLLYNHCNNPLYLLCFAAGNPKGAKTAVDIAEDILKE